jgi:hypothetical protein
MHCHIHHVEKKSEMASEKLNLLQINQLNGFRKKDRSSVRLLLLQLQPHELFSALGKSKNGLVFCIKNKRRKST